MYLKLRFQAVITFTEEELKGVPKDVVSGYTKRTEGSKDVYDVTYKTPDIFPIVSSYPSFLPPRIDAGCSSNLRRIQKLVGRPRKVMNPVWK